MLTVSHPVYDVTQSSDSVVTFAFTLSSSCSDEPIQIAIEGLTNDALVYTIGDSRVSLAYSASTTMACGDFTFSMQTYLDSIVQMDSSEAVIELYSSSEAELGTYVLGTPSIVTLTATMVTSTTNTASKTFTVTIIKPDECPTASVSVTVGGLSEDSVEFFVGEEARLLPLTYSSSIDCGAFTVELNPDLSPVISIVNTAGTTSVLLVSEDAGDISALNLTPA